MSVRVKLFFSHILAALLVCGGIGTYFYSSAAESLRDSLEDRLRSSAVLISQTMDAIRLKSIRAPEDGNRPEYIEIL